MRPGAAGSVPWWERGRPRASAVLSQLVPSSPGAQKARATPAPDPAQQARVCTWMSAGPTGMACSGAASEVAGPRAQPFPSRKRRGTWKTRGAPRASRATYAPSCPRVPHGPGPRAGVGPAATASGAASLAAGRSGRCGSPKAAVRGKGGAVQRPRGGPLLPEDQRPGSDEKARGAGTLAPSCVQPADLFQVST